MYCISKASIFARLPPALLLGPQAGGSVELVDSKFNAASDNCLRLLTQWARRAASRAAWTAGRSKAIRTAMIAITTSSSINVKARRRIGSLRLKTDGHASTRIERGSIGDAGRLGTFDDGRSGRASRARTSGA